MSNGYVDKVSAVGMVYDIHVPNGTIDRAMLDTDLQEKTDAVDDLQSAISGAGESGSATEASGLNFGANATKYTSNGNYTTFYVATEKGKEYVFNLSNTSANTFYARFAKSSEIPANNVSGTYLGESTVSSHGNGTYSYIATESGYVSVSHYVLTGVGFTLSVFTGGFSQRVPVLENDTTKMGDAVDTLDATVNGTTSSAELTNVDGINFAENATKYSSSGNYGTWYLAVQKGNDYDFTITSTSANGFEARFAFSTSVPAANVEGKYIGKKSTSAHSSATFHCIAEADGYIGVAWYKNNDRIGTVTETSGGVKQKVNLYDQYGTKINALETVATEAISKRDGKTVSLESGTYWGATTVGTSVESQIQTSTSSVAKRTTLTLPANKVLRIMGVGISDLTRLYWVFSASTGILIDIVDATDQLAPRGYYLRYNEDTHIYINCANAYDHFIGIVDDVSPWVDISRCIGQTTRKIIDFGERDIRYAVRSMKRRSRNGSSYAPALFLHFSDIHGDAENLTRLMEFASDKHISNYLSDILCTGDVVKSTIDDGMTWFDAISGTNKILLLPGNHDSVKGTASSPTTASKQEMYETLFEGRVSNWNVTQPSDAATAYKGYYYKDYSAAKLRLICLDANGSGDYQTTEVAWLADALEGARGLGYSVVCAEHFMFDRSVCTGVKCTFQSDEEPENEGTWTIPAAYVNAVETFISNGGDFVCWMGGHVHKDRLWIHNNTHQLCIGVTTASHETHQISYEDSERIAGDKSQDAFNIIGFDTFAKRITILKIGSDLTRVLAHKRYLCIDYANRTVLFND